MSGSCRCSSCPIGASQPGQFGGPFPCCQGTLHLLLHRTSPEPDASQMLFWGRTGSEWGFFAPSLCWYKKKRCLYSNLNLELPNALFILELGRRRIMEKL